MRMTTRRRSAVSPVIATLLLIAIAVAAAIIVYAFVTGLIGGLTGGGGSNLVTVSGNLIVPTGLTTGTLVLNLKNSAANPIQAIYVTFPVSSTGATSQFTYGGSMLGTCFGGQIGGGGLCTTNFTFNGGPITAANPLPVGSETSASATVTTGAGQNWIQAGNHYSFAITCWLSNGSPQTQLVSLTAAL
jgi:flagellin-like protein